MTKTTTRKTAEQRKAEANRLHDTIAEQVAQLTTSDGWTQFLKMATGFHRYSVNNLFSILSQRPDATQVAGFRQWQERGRQVRRGETGIRIFGYSTKIIEAAEDDEEESRRAIFPVLTVFDIAQTDSIDGAPTLDIAPRLEGADVTGIFGLVEAWLTGQGWTVSREILRGEDGATSIDGTRRVRIDSALSPAHAAVTIVHEAAHATMHEGITDYHQHRGIYEVEAESVAYVVSGALGLDTGSNSIGYIASWARGDLDLIRETARRVLSVAHRIIDQVEISAAT